MPGRRPCREHEPDDDEQCAGERDARDRREREEGEREAAHAADEDFPARSPERRREEAAGEGADPEAGAEDAERLRPGVESLGGEQRQDDVEVEADRREHGDQDQDLAQPRLTPRESERLPAAAQEGQLLLAALEWQELLGAYDEQPSCRVEVEPQVSASRRRWRPLVSWRGRVNRSLLQSRCRGAGCLGRLQPGRSDLAGNHAACAGDWARAPPAEPGQRVRRAGAPFSHRGAFGRGARGFHRAFERHVAVCLDRWTRVDRWWTRFAIPWCKARCGVCTA